MFGYVLSVRKGEDVMITKTGKRRWALLSGAVATLVLIAQGGVALADTASDKAGAILIFPKIIVDTAGVLGPPTDTEIQITNASNSIVSARCWWVNATYYCSNNRTRACIPEREANPNTRRCDTGARCDQQWSEQDFLFTLTKRQPIAFTASIGLPNLPLSNGKFGPGGQTNDANDGRPSSIFPVVDDPFIGELKCVEVSPDTFAPTIGFNPANNASGDLVGHATIVSATPGVGAASAAVDARKYNGIVLESTTINDGDETLVVGGPNAEYNGCPNVLIAQHFFDDAVVPSGATGQIFASNSTVHTDLTFIPCSENFRLQENDLGGATLQFLVFNEFEQRFSASTSFTCFREIRLSDIDTRPGTSDNSKSIFNVNVQGTLSGQTRIRAVSGPNRANGVLGIQEQFFTCTSGPGGTCSTAENLHFTGSRVLSDQIILSPDIP